MTLAISPKSSTSQAMLADFDEAKVDSLFAQINQSHLPGVAVGIAIAGQPVYRKGFGLASIELPVVLSPSIRMRLGSVTKHFTAFTFMLLCEEGKAHIDDPIGKYFPEFHPVSRGITLRQLMTHTSGLRDVADIKVSLNSLETAPVGNNELLALYQSIDDVNDRPGVGYLYNNGGYWILGAAIERICRQPLEEVFWTRVFEPLGMRDTLLRRWDKEFVPNSATPHMKIDGRWLRGDYGMEHYFGAGGIVSTIDDMLRWLAHMGSPRPGTAATWAAMTCPHTLPNGTSTGYGLGLNLSPYRGTQTIWHLGGGCGCKATMVKVPSAGLDIIIMSNRDDIEPGILGHHLMDICLSLDRVEEQVKGRVASGIFHSPATARVIQLNAKDSQQMVCVNGSETPFMPDESGVLRPIPLLKSFNLQWSVQLRGDPEEPTSIQFNDCGNKDDLVRLDPAASVDLNEVTGQYRSETTGTTVEIRNTDTGPMFLSQGRFGRIAYRLEPLAAGIYQARALGLRPYGATLAFDSERRTFRFSNFNNRGLVFRRYH